LVELEEDKFIAGFHQHIQKEWEKAYHDKHIRKKSFKQGDMILVYENNFMKIQGSLEHIGWDHMSSPMLPKQEMHS
jgi:hypothetical protein